ncbi:MAG: hypothetical protein ACO1NW_00415 [Chitinophagaceae bacterium]
MRKVFFFLLAACAGQLSAQTISKWKPLGPFSIHKQTGEPGAPGLGVFRSIDIHPSRPQSILMGGMTSGIWLSENKGKSWSNVTAGLPVENIKKIQFARSNAQIVYAASTVGILRSADAGKTWAFTALNILHKLPCANREKWNDDRTLLSVSPTQPNTVVASNPDTVFQTRNGGNSWQAVLPGFLSQFIEYHPTNASIIYVGGAYAKERNRFVLLRSTNGGKSFEPMTNGIPDASKLVSLSDITAAVTPAAPDQLSILIFGNAKVKTTVKQEEKNQMVGAFITSKNKGESFEPVKQSTNYREIDEYYSLFYNYSADEDKEKYDFDYKDSSFWQASFQQVGWATAFNISPTDPNFMVMAASGAVYSKDAGRTWHFLRKQGSYGIHGDIQHAKIIGNDVWLVNDGGINYVNMLNPVNHRLEGYSGQDLWGFSTSFKTDVMAVGVDHSGTMIYDKNIYGNDWYHYGGGDAMTASVNLFDDRYIYATPYTHAKIKRPTTLRDEPVTEKSKISLGYIPHRNLEFHPNLVYTFYGIDEDKPHWKYEYCRVVGTSDNMRTMDTLLTMPFKSYGKRVRISVSNPDYLYAINQKPHQVWKTTDGGKTWDTITPTHAIALKYGFSDIAISDVDPNEIFLSVAGFQNEVKVLRSKDGGKTWTDHYSNELPRNEILTMALQRGTKNGLYLGCEPGVFYRSETAGKWKEVGTGLPYTPAHFISLNYDKAKIRIGTYRGIWECDFAEDFAPRALIALNKKALPSGRSDDMKVFFYDHSALKRTGAKWQWEFPGSIQGSSTEENPIIDYEAAKPGKYSVKLTVTDGKGRKSSYELKDYIEVRRNYSWNVREEKLEQESEREYEE